MAPIHSQSLFIVLALSVQSTLAQAQEQPDWNDVGEIFARRCVNCHADHGAAENLRLDSYEKTIAGSENGAVLLPGNPADSEMIRRLRGDSKPRMPFLSTPLPEEEIDLIVRWVEAGLPISSQ